MTDAGLFPNRPGGGLPEKEPGVHRWIATAAFTVTDAEAAQAAAGREAVLLDASRLFSPVEIGCVDCEAPHRDVATRPCPAGDEFTDTPLARLTADPTGEGLSPEARDALLAGVELVGRSGAKDFTMGYLRDDVPISQAGWWAKAQYAGAELRIERPDPVEAVEALARRILTGATCAHCHRKVKLGGSGGNSCRWYREGARWFRGCEART